MWYRPWKPKRYIKWPRPHSYFVQIMILRRLLLTHRFSHRIQLLKENVLRWDILYVRDRMSTVFYSTLTSIPITRLADEVCSSTALFWSEARTMITCENWCKTRYCNKFSSKVHWHMTFIIRSYTLVAKQIPVLLKVQILFITGLLYKCRPLVGVFLSSRA